jgi:hypothetical protein
MAAQATPLSDDLLTPPGMGFRGREISPELVSARLARLLTVMLFIATAGALFGRGWQLAGFPKTMPLLSAGIINTLGWMGIATGAALLISLAVPRLRTPVLLGSAAILGLMAVIGWLPHPVAVSALFRPIAQVAAPLMLILAMRRQWDALITVGCWATGLCFTAHAFLDLGIPATPPEYLKLTNVLLAVDDHGGRSFLAAAAAFDLIASAALFWRRTRVAALWATAAWGLMTASARLAAFGYLDFPKVLGEPWVHATLWRLPHALLPAATALLVMATTSGEAAAAVTEPALGGPAKLSVAPTRIDGPAARLASGPA